MMQLQFRVVMQFTEVWGFLTKDCKTSNALFSFVTVAGLLDFGRFLTLTTFLKTLNSIHYSSF